MFKFFKNRLIYIIKKSIELIERYEYRNISLDEEDINKKILNSISILNIKVKTDTGYEPVTDIHITQPYKYYEVETIDFKLSCADNHILFTRDFKEIFTKELKIGDLIQTEKGTQEVISIESSNFKSSMFDITVDHPNHRFYTNGILSHNTISSAIFMLHTILFNNDKNVMIVANKGDTAVEIVDKIKSIYTLLPFFLKPGIKTWNQKSLTFENGCRIKTSARSKTPAIGFTIDVLYLDEFAHIPSNIIEPYYTAAFPTVSAVENSKIIITSTPNGMNLFHKLLINAERKSGDPQKNNYKAMRVYWHQVPGRFVTYIRLNDHLMYDYGVTKEDIFSMIQSKYPESITKTKMYFNSDIQKWVISIFNNDICSDEDIKLLSFIDGKGFETSLRAISEMTTWKEEAIKDIGGEDSFNQEYGLRFINSSKSLLNESIIEGLINNKKSYKSEEIEEFNKLRFSHKDLKIIDDNEIYNSILRKSYKVILSVDIAEGLGQDYSVVNIFKLSVKDKDTIDSQKHKYQVLTDFFKLEQIGIFRSNIISLKQLAEFIYVLAFDYFNPDNVKIVLELNNYGGTLLAEMPHVFEGNNNYGSYIFVRYKHRIDSTEEKIGLKVGENKNLMVKDYQDLMSMKSFYINEEDTINEITTFVKHTTSAGNIRYAADVGNDDCVMTIVNSTTVFTKVFFKSMVDDYMNNQLDSFTKSYINECIRNMDNHMETADYSHFLSIRRKALGSKR